MQDFKLHADTRTETGKSYAKELRREGKVPGIYYIRGQKSVPLILEEKELHKLLDSQYSLIDLKLNKKAQKCLIREVQFDPISGDLLHVDFLGVSAKEKITATVPIHLNGTPVGVRDEGAILHQDIREIEVECLPANLPQTIEIDVSNLHTDDSVYVRDISIADVTFVIEDDRVIASVRQLKIAKLDEEEVPETEEEAETEADSDGKAKEEDSEKKSE